MIFIFLHCSRQLNIYKPTLKQKTIIKVPKGLYQALLKDSPFSQYSEQWLVINYNGLLVGASKRFFVNWADSKNPNFKIDIEEIKEIKIRRLSLI